MIADLSSIPGWSNVRLHGISAWYKGYVWLDGRMQLGRQAAALLSKELHNNIDNAATFLRSLEGHFAIITTRDNHTIFATDRIRSIPLFWARTRSGYRVDADASRLRSLLDTNSIDHEALLELSMSGYVLGNGTLYQDMRQVQAGEVVIIKDRNLTAKRYYTYDAWKPPRTTDQNTLRRELIDEHHAMFERLAEGLSGRPVMIPLSGGLDSRLVAAGLSEVGYRDVHCFAYGRPGNFEADKSREVAEKLDYKWTFVPYTPRTVRDFAKSKVQSEHDRYVDTYAGVPFQQDLFAIAQLTDNKAVPADAVFVNGQSGDFITGNHIPKSLQNPTEHLDHDSCMSRIQDALIAKHFSLWKFLKTPKNIIHIRKKLNEAIKAAGAPELDQTSAPGTYELIELQERQSKFVVSGQRVYEFFGHDWRLPLWDNTYIDFFERAPLAAKEGQSLYRDALAESNWGGVWQPLLPTKYPTPRWAGFARKATRAALIWLPQQHWDVIDRQVFGYLLDPLCVGNLVDFSTYALDSRGARHGVAWRTEAYLNRHALPLGQTSDLAAA